MDTTGRVLGVLVRAGKPISGSQLAKELGVSRSYVHRLIDELRSCGYGIEGHTRRGYVLTGVPDTLEPRLLRAHITCGNFGRELDYHDEIDSTNRRAVALAARGAGEGLVVLAESQTEGRGRLRRRWLSPRGGLWFSVLLRPEVEPQRAGALPLVAGLAVAMAMEHFGLEPQLKWPNDVLLSQKKVCGVLCETGMEPGRLEHVVIGIGVNANNHPPVKDATSIAVETGGAVDRARLLAKILQLLEREYIRWLEDANAFMEPWRKRSITPGQKVRVETATGGGAMVIEGVATGIDSNGALLVESGGTTVEVLWGDCIHLQ